MEPAEIEFLAENEYVEIIPNFYNDRLYLISGEIGPFRAGIPIRVPIWLAANLKARQKCRLVAPSWMNVEELEDLKQREMESAVFCEVPSEHYIIEAHVLMRIADGDIGRPEALRTVIKDIWDKRLAKLRTSVDTFIKHGGTHAKLDHLTAMESTSVRPLLPHSLDFLNRLSAPRGSQTQYDTQNRFTNSMSFNSSSLS